MNQDRKKEIKAQWMDRKPEMGVLSIHCKATGQAFLVISKDNARVFNRHRFQLSAGMHPNKALQALWAQYGEDGFACTVAKVLKYEDPAEDHTEELEDLLEQCLSEMPQAERL